MINSSVGQRACPADPINIPDTPISVPAIGHTFIAGRCGSGKTSMAKTLISEYGHRDGAIVVWISPIASGLTPDALTDRLTAHAREVEDAAFRPGRDSYRHNILVLDEVYLGEPGAFDAIVRILAYGRSANTHVILTAPDGAEGVSRLRAQCQTMIALDPGRMRPQTLEMLAPSMDACIVPRADSSACGPSTFLVSVGAATPVAGRAPYYVEEV